MYLFFIGSDISGKVHKNPVRKTKLQRSLGKTDDIKIVLNRGILLYFKHIFRWANFLPDTWSFFCCPKGNATDNRYKNVDTYFSFEHVSCSSFSIHIQTVCLYVYMYWFSDFYFLVFYINIYLWISDDAAFLLFWCFNLLVFFLVFFSLEKKCKHCVSIIYLHTIITIIVRKINLSLIIWRSYMYV